MAEEERSAEDRVGDMLFGAPEKEPEVAEEEVAEEVEAQEEPEEEPDEAQEGEIEAKEDEEEYAEVEIDGELLQVPAKYKDYFLRQQDYTQKTQELSQQRQEVEVVRQQAEQAQKHYEFTQSIWDELVQAQQADTLAEQYQNYLRENIDNLSSSDIEKIRFQVEEARNQKNQIAQALNQKWEEHQQAQQQSFQELLNKGTEVLKQKIPNWGEAQQKQVREYALANGFTEQEVSHVVDPRQVEVLWKAAQYDQLKEGAKPAVQKVQKAPKIKPKSRNPMPKDTQDKLNLRKKIKNPNRPSKEKQKDIGQYIGSKFGF